MNKDTIIEMALALTVLVDEEEVREILLGEGYNLVQIEDFLDIAATGVL